MNQNLKLYKTQKIIFNAIVNSPDSGTQSNKNKESVNQFDVLSVLKEKPPISIQQRIGIYQDAYQIRLFEAMRDDFERLFQYLGEEDFTNIVFQYLEEYPSIYASIAEVGKKFPQFLKKNFASEEKYFSLASLDWIEVEAQYFSEIPMEKRVKSEQIQLGSTFRLILNPTLHYFVNNEGIHLAFLVREYIKNKIIQEADLLFIGFFQDQKSFSEIESFCQLHQISDDKIQNLIEDWVKDEVLICLKN